MHNHKSLQEIHEDVPAEHYDKGIKRNLFQKYWHFRRFTEVQKAIKPIKGAFLDIGCHSGTFTSKVLEKIGSKKVYGLDISPSAIKLVSKRIPFGKFQVGDAGKLPYKSNYFTAAFCLEMLEHVDSPKQALSEIRRVLKKDGYAVILVPSDNKLFKFVWFIWTLYYPVWRHAHVQSFQNKDLEKLLKKLKFRNIKTKTFNLGMLKLITCIK
jgi:ubiquinone/menaquinone biosynthesis C-methylase UbiE